MFNVIMESVNRRIHHIRFSYKITFTIIFLLCGFLSNASKNISTINYTPKDYHADRQNWSVSAGQNGNIYFANNYEGLLVFDGTTWKIYSPPNRSILRSVKVFNDTIIYTSGYMELGYWKPDKFGDLNYYSLTSKAKKYLKTNKNIEFWNIAIQDDYIYFRSFNDILVFHDDSITPIYPDGTASVMNRVNDKVLFATPKGIFQIIGTTVKPFIESDFFTNKLVKFITPFNQEKILIGTEGNGIFIWDGKKLSEWNSKWTDYFIKNQPNRSTVTPTQVIIGTIVDGIVIFDHKGNLITQLNAQNGLTSNTVLGIGTDPWDNIWLALDDGIAFICDRQKKSFQIEKIPGIGAVYAAALLDSNLYLGTNQGLFVRPKENNNRNVEFVPGTQDQVWNLKIIDGKLWAGHNRGTFEVDGKNAHLISSSQPGGFAINEDPLNPGQLIQCTYSSLIVYKKDNDNYHFDHRIKNFDDLIQYIEIDHLGNIWLGHMRKAVYKVTTDDSRDSVIAKQYYGSDVFGQDHSVHVFNVENRIVFTSGRQIFTYDDLTDTIIPYVSLNRALGEFESSHRIIVAPDHHYWFVSENNIGLFKIEHDSVKLIKNYPTALFDPPVVDRFENILPTSEVTAILCLHNGIAKLNANIQDPVELMGQHLPLLRHAEMYNNRGKLNLIPLHQQNIKIRYNFHNLMFRFSFPKMDDLPIHYQYMITGINPNWSAKTTIPEFRIERLPAGKYDLQVKAVDLWGNESKTFKFSFEILPVWYASKTAISVYVILFVAILLFFRSWGIRQTRRKENLQHEKREKELIRLRNEKLNNEIQHKSKELASSTMAIIKKNEFLLTLKDIIDNQKQELGSRFPDKYYSYLNNRIDENISNQDDWQIFETNFEQAHEQFFQKIKTKYPELTSSDLRLCAFLHMNLSSKEIAPLLGISARGVENHRYRLRKKMNLEHDDSLIDVINGI